MNPIKKVHAKITFKDSDGNEHVVTDNNVTQSKFDPRPGAINCYKISEGRLMPQSEYEKKRDESAESHVDLIFDNYGMSVQPSQIAQPFEESNEASFKAGSDFGREYSKAEYDQLMKDARTFIKYLEFFIGKRKIDGVISTGYSTQTEKVTELLENFDKKYPQLNEKE